MLRAWLLAVLQIIIAVKLVQCGSFDASIPTPEYTVFVSKSQPDTKLRFVKNSGVCETTRGVDQISGYIDVGTNMSMVSLLYLQERWSLSSAPYSGSGFSRRERILRLHLSLFGGVFSFYAVRLSLKTRRLNGGPGCSSMIGLFQGRLSRYVWSISHLNGLRKRTMQRPAGWRDYGYQSLQVKRHKC